MLPSLLGSGRCVFFSVLFLILPCQSFSILELLQPRDTVPAPIVVDPSQDWYAIHCQRMDETLTQNAGMETMDLGAPSHYKLALLRKMSKSSSQQPRHRLGPWPRRAAQPVTHLTASISAADYTITTIPRAGNQTSQI